ncbi:MAG TPA: phosphoglucosamine mutase [Vicinamibacterales bacterium]|jgi:phosphoglucosamine mutase|nr:phosphoglucosamine mutase [Vicinamibacterales bacterium]
MARLFGTDGVRGKAGEFPLDVPTVRRLGGALVRALRHDDEPSAPHPQGIRFLSGRDTRESGSWIERELAFGVRSQGGVLTSAGIVPTPAIAYLTPRMGYTAGVVISASHNPFEDNGIKVFSGAGEKFTETLEHHVESIMEDPSWSVPGGDAPAVEQIDYRAEYIGHLKDILPADARTKGMRIAVDCANGATTTVAPRLFAELGFEARCIGCEPDGRNINLRCGSTAPEALAGVVLEDGYALGIAYDGDGDRAIFVDAAGKIVDGDAVMLLCAKQMQREARLRGNAVVATVMSNIGLELALRDAGIDIVRCPVGDKYVMEEMLKRGIALGGEQSGHVIFSDYLFTGDGLATSLNVLRTMAATGRSLAHLASEMTAFPQVLLNLRVQQKIDLKTIPEVAATMTSVESRLAGHGRLLVRYSGTEPLLRVMLEGRDEREIRAWGQEIIDAVKASIGVAV